MLTELREVDLWEWEGRDKEELKAAEPERYQAWQSDPCAFQMASGHTPVVEMWERAAAAWER